MLGWGGYQYQDGVEKETKLRKAISRNLVTEESSYQSQIISKCPRQFSSGTLLCTQH